MGYPDFGNISMMPLPRSLVRLVILVDYICFGFEVIFFYFGLPQLSLWANESYVSSVPTAKVSPAFVKSRLPVVKYRNLIDHSKVVRCSRETTCAVCLMEIEACDKVRELGNCWHALHVACIDLWIDAGQLTCPLCRSQLLACHEKKERGGSGFFGKFELI